MARPHLLGPLLLLATTASAAAAPPCPNSTWDTITPCSRADLDGDGAIGFTDLTTVLTHWGAAPTAWTLDHGSARVETTVQADTPGACTTVRSITANGLGAVDAAVAESSLGVSVAAACAAGITIDGASTVLTITGTTSYVPDGIVGADATAVSIVESEFDVLEPIACTLAFTYCNPTDATRLVSDNGFERVCNQFTGVLAPGHYTLRGTAFSDDVELTGGFGATLTLHDARGADLDDDGTIGLGDVLTILSAWGPCGP